MKNILFACLIVSTAVQAQVIECPKFYPWEDTTVAEGLPGHRGKGLVEKTSLDGASVAVGAVNHGSLLSGDRKKLKEGKAVEYRVPNGPKWFVCHYGRDVAWWEELDNNFSRCRLEIKNKNSQGTMEATLTCK